jgi:hypothetical protein
VSIPLTLGAVQGTDVVRPLVSVSVGGGPPVLVTLDTGSYGLRILPTALGPDAVHIPDTAHAWSVTAVAVSTARRSTP